MKLPKTTELLPRRTMVVSLVNTRMRCPHMLTSIHSHLRPTHHFSRPQEAQARRHPTAHLA